VGEGVSVVATVKGEPLDRLARLVEAVVAQDVGRGIELVLAADPAERRTLEMLRAGGAVERIVVVDNPGGRRSPGLNRALRAASGPVVCRVDARTLPPPDYVRTCVKRLESDPEVGLVGGVQWPQAGGPTAQAAGVARALRNPWLLGGAAYRRPGRSGPVDTVYLGAFRRDEVLALGGYDERLDANEDFDLAQRYRARRSTVWLEEGLVAGYEARRSVPEVFGQYYAFGRSKVRFWRLAGRGPNPRQVVALGLGLTGTALLAGSLRRPGRAAALVGLALAGAVAVDHAGDPHERRLEVRAASIAAGAAVTAGWLAGVARELVSPAATAGLRDPNAVTGLRDPNAVTGLRDPNAVTGLRGSGPGAGPGSRG
jgi:succinoglycan biosynthesis protein ExoA